ncbi:hypothetical protein NUW54_g14055 [Trametes sanguinea]|uniref:Uncharacterized protein n=1 Tax=Trametes sanguinea TaxID=158606 RepID=A0ACC1MF75_9APHY|nr:hypothetical protein NUW54_g14055 [Trametes sanguinea]
MNIGAAPRHMILWGAVDGPTNERRLRLVPPNATLVDAIGHAGPRLTHGYTYVPLALIEYDINAVSHVQTFAVDPYVARSGMDFGVVVLEILSNWGGPDTCLYRVRLHGRPISDI